MSLPVPLSFDFSLLTNVIVCGVKRPSRETIHKKEKFRINLFNLKIIFTITPEAIKIYEEINDDGVSLFDVQNAINLTLLQYEEINTENVKNNLRKYYKKEI